MPQVRKLRDEEIRTIERKTLGQRRATEIEYDRLLADFSPGDYGEATLHDDEKRLTVRNRLKAAASRHDPPLAIAFQRTRGETLRFSVEAAESVPGSTSQVPVATPSSVPTPTPAVPTGTAGAEPASPPRRRGRTSRSTAETAPATPQEKRPRRRRTSGEG
jgi:hypothetical protein